MRCFCYFLALNVTSQIKKYSGGFREFTVAARRKILIIMQHFFYLKLINNFGNGTV